MSPSMKSICSHPSMLAGGALALAACTVFVGPSATASDPDRTAEAIKHAVSLADAFEHVAEIIQPSVVSISAVRSVESGERRSPLREFFGGDPFGPPDDDDQRFWRAGQGSGFVVRPDGYIVTNNHVVEGADRVLVRLADERTVRASIVGTDPKTDLAVLRVKGETLPALALGNSEQLRVGEWVVAAGNPFGLSSTITAGIVSAKGRTGVGITDYEDFIQTDAAINPGNSGGPLVNLEGEVVGINTAIFTRTGGSSGIGFAIPVDLARGVVNSLVDNGRVVRGWLGVSIQNLDDAMASSFGLESPKGALVGDVLVGGPAARAGLERGDVILRIDGAMIDDIDKLRFKVAEIAPGSEAQVEVVRDRRRRTIPVRIGEQAQNTSRAPAPEPASGPDLGLELETLTAASADALGIDEGLRGVLVTDVESYSPAAASGLRPGDVIIDVDGKGIRDLEEFRSVVDALDLAAGARLTVRSGELQRFVLLRRM